MRVESGRWIGKSDGDERGTDSDGDCVTGFDLGFLCFLLGRAPAPTARDGAAADAEEAEGVVVVAELVEELATGLGGAGVEAAHLIDCLTA